MARWERWSKAEWRDKVEGMEQWFRSMRAKRQCVGVNEDFLETFTFSSAWMLGKALPQIPLPNLLPCQFLTLESLGGSYKKIQIPRSQICESVSLDQNLFPQSPQILCSLRKFPLTLHQCLATVIWLVQILWAIPFFPIFWKHEYIQKVPVSSTDAIQIVPPQ